MRLCHIVKVIKHRVRQDHRCEVSEAFFTFIGMFLAIFHETRVDGLDNHREGDCQELRYLTCILLVWLNAQRHQVALGSGRTVNVFHIRGIFRYVGQCQYVALERRGTLIFSPTICATPLYLQWMVVSCWASLIASKKYARQNVTQRTSHFFCSLSLHVCFLVLYFYAT